VPRAELSEVVDAALARADGLFKRSPGALSHYVERAVATHFNVTGACAGVRVSQDRLLTPSRLRSVGSV